MSSGCAYSIGGLNGPGRIVVDSEFVEIQTITGSYRLRSDQVVSIVRVRPFPWLSTFLGIHHNSPEVPHRIYIGAFPFGVGGLKEFIARAEFRPSAPPATDRWRQPMAWRLGFLVWWAIGWNALFLLDRAYPRLLHTHSGREVDIPGPWAAVATGLTACLGIAGELSPTVRKWMVKPGRSFSEIRLLTRFVSFIAGVLSLALMLT